MTRHLRNLTGATAFVGLALAMAGASAKPLDGVTLNVASMNDQFATVMAEIAPNSRKRRARMSRSTFSTTARC